MSKSQEKFLRKNPNYYKDYYLKNKEKITEAVKKYYCLHREEKIEYAKKYNKVYFKNNPWLKVLSSITSRCKYPQCHKYKYYGGKGIINKLTSKDIKFLWFRDKAHLMKQPSINRKNTSKNYTPKNCEFIEMAVNRTQRTYKKKSEISLDKIPFI